MFFLVNAYGLNGMGLEAIDLYRQIRDYLHSEVSYICVLNACLILVFLIKLDRFSMKFRIKQRLRLLWFSLFFISSINLLSLPCNHFQILNASLSVYK